MTTETPSVSPKTPVARYLHWVRIDTALLIAAIAGALTLNGYAYLEKYYLTLGVPIDRLGFPAQKFAAYGAASGVSFISAVFVVSALVGILTLGMVILDRPRPIHMSATSSRWRWVRYIAKRVEAERLACRIVFLVTVGAIFALITWYLLLKMPGDMGYERAINEARNCAPQQALYKTDSYSGCVVAETADTLYLVHKQGTIDNLFFKTLLLPKDGLIKVEGSAPFPENKTLNLSLKLNTHGAFRSSRR